MIAEKKKVLVIGGGISGLTAAVEASEVGHEVVVVERNPFLGGRVAQLYQYFPKLCPPLCGIEINLRRIRTSPRITCHTCTTVTRVAGGPGDYKVTLTQHPRFVKPVCTACGECSKVCPVERPDTFNCSMSQTKAIYTPFEMADPMGYLIDKDVCTGSECAKCVEACSYDAIDLDMPPVVKEIHVSSVIVATGWDPYDAAKIEPLGYGKYPNVITNLMMERLAATSGPTGGKIQRPSDGKDIKSIAFVQCAGSRDENHLAHCSGVCCMATLKQTRYVREQYPDAQIFVFYIDIRTPGRLEDFYEMVQGDEKVSLVKGKVGEITEDADANLTLEAEDILSGTRVHQKVDLVVLATGVVPSDAGIQADGWLPKDSHGFLVPDEDNGVVPAGCAKQPMDVGACARDAVGAALKSIQCGGGVD